MTGPDATPNPAADTGTKKKQRTAAQTKYAVYTLADAVAVADTIHRQGGGVAASDELAIFLGYKSANNGAYYDKISASRMFGLIQGQGARITLTKRAEQVLMPVFPEQAAHAKVEAWMDVPLFAAIYEEFRGRQLPPEEGLKNLMRTKYGVPPSRVDSAYRALIESADQAGFFSRGTRTHLIVPRTGTDAPINVAREAEDTTEVSESVTATGTRANPVAPGSTEELRNVYVGTLIEMLRQKGEPDPDLMAKIESLLGLSADKKKG